MIKTDDFQPITTPDELARYLGKIEQVFDLDALLSEDIDEEDVVEYYEQSDYGYRVFHSTEGSVHMALNFDGKFDKEGYYGQAKIVENHIKEENVIDILELASGKGFNSIFLSKRHPNRMFTGIDITPTHVAQAQKNSKGLPNLSFAIGNFMQLEFQDAQYDLLFEVESICHATDMRVALSEAYRVLRPGGKMILFDGFRTPLFSEAPETLKKASKLVEVSMAVGHAWNIDDWLNIADETGFSIIKYEDIADAIKPNLYRFQKLARGYFKFPSLASGLLRILPPDLVKNSIAGLLMPFTIEAGIQGYYKIILQK